MTNYTAFYTGALSRPQLKLIGICFFDPIRPVPTGQGLRRFRLAFPTLPFHFCSMPAHFSLRQPHPQRPAALLTLTRVKASQNCLGSVGAEWPRTWRRQRKCGAKTAQAMV
jgi:hypothetical protein